MNCSAFLAVKISIEKSSIILRDCPLHVDYVGCFFFFLVAFNTLSLLYLLRILSGICHVIAFVYLMFGFLYSFIFKDVAFLTLGKFWYMSSTWDSYPSFMSIIQMCAVGFFCLIFLVCYFPF